MPKGDAAEAEYDTVIDGTGMLCYPGLVNAHHHLYQIFSRNLPQVQNMELFDWLTTLYEVWKNLNEDTIRLSSTAVRPSLTIIMSFRKMAAICWQLSGRRQKCLAHGCIFPEGPWICPKRTEGCRRIPSYRALMRS